MPAPDGPALAVVGLTRRFAGRTVVDGLSLSVDAGEVVGLLGPNGAGKTTAFRMISGLVRPHAGQVTIAGRRAEALPLWRRVRLGLGYLPQEPSLLRDLSVMDNLRVPLEARGLRGADATEAARALLVEQDLSHLAGARAGTLSGGERRRVELARCLATAPSVVLLDEPFSGVDPVAVSGLQRQVRALAERGLAVLITDHAVHATLPICDRAVVLDQGRVMASGEPSRIAADPVVQARYLGPRFQLAPTPQANEPREP